MSPSLQIAGGSCCEVTLALWPMAHTARPNLRPALWPMPTPTLSSQSARPLPTQTDTTHCPRRCDQHGDPIRRPTKDHWTALRCCSLQSAGRQKTLEILHSHHATRAPHIVRDESYPPGRSLPYDSALSHVILHPCGGGPMMRRNVMPAESETAARQMRLARGDGGPCGGWQINHDQTSSDK
jgi:hypothetical protein